mgnify:CR=1 FL=1
MIPRPARLALALALAAPAAAVYAASRAGTAPRTTERSARTCAAAAPSWCCRTGSWAGLALAACW